MPEVAFPKWQKEKVERTDFSRVCLLKGRSRDVEWNNQAASSEQTWGSTFSPAPCVGVARLCTPSCSACWGPKWARKSPTESHGWKAFWELLLTKKQLFLTAQESSNFRLPEAGKVCPGRSPCTHGVSLTSSSKQQQKWTHGMVQSSPPRVCCLAELLNPF